MPDKGMGGRRALAVAFLIGALLWGGVRIAVAFYQESAWDAFWAGEVRQAITFYERADSLDPSSVEAVMGGFDIRVTSLGGIPSSDEDFGQKFSETSQDCARILGSLVERAPLRPETWNAVSEFYAVLKPENQKQRVYSLEEISLEEGANLEREDIVQIRALEMSLVTDPNAVYYRDRLGNLAWGLGLRELALENYQEGVVLEPDPSEHLYLAPAEVDPDISDRVIAGMEMSIRSPREADAETVYRKLGRFYLKHERFAEASDAFARAQEAASKPVNYVYLQAYAQSRLGNKDQALELYRGSLSTDDLSKDARFQTHLNLGDLFGEMGRYQEAAREIRAALVITPRQSRALLSLGRIYEQMNMLEEAEESYNRATEVAGDHISALVNLISFYRRVGQLHKALPAARKLVQLDPDEAVYREQLDQILNETTFGAR